MAIRRLGVIMHGVTGRMGTNQHLIRSIMAIRADGGVPLKGADRAMPDPILVGRNADKLAALAQAHGIERWTTDLAGAFSNADDEVFFDAGTTQMRPALIRQAIAAGKHIYCEKPIATNLADALSIARLAEARGVKNGVVQDKLFLPGLLKLKMLKESGFFGRILSVRGEFGYWVFEGDLQPIQRPSWNYRAEDGGGIILDMICHWRYVLDNVFAPVRSLTCLGATHIPRRWDETGEAYPATADDAAYATFVLDGDIVAQVNSSWATRVYRDDLATFQVDGTHGSAIAGLQGCRIQQRMATPRPVWNPDEKRPDDFFAQWQEMPESQTYINGFRRQWEMFIRHVVEDAPWQYSLLEGAKGVQLVELARDSWKARRWVDVPELSLGREDVAVRGRRHAG
jgi:predicted dehydrogenase